MTAPRAKAVCSRFRDTPTPYIAILIIGVGILGTTATLAIGYFMAYRNLDNSDENQDYGVGICFDAKYPGIRRACILDMVGSVMSISLGSFLLIMECFSAYINQRDWKILFSIVKICIATVTASVLLAGTIQGTTAYSDFCNDNTDFHYGYKKCQFSKHSNTYYRDVDFVAVIALSGIGILCWIAMLTAEIIRFCWLYSQSSSSDIQYELLPTATDQLED